MIDDILSTHKMLQKSIQMGRPMESKNMENFEHVYQAALQMVKKDEKVSDLPTHENSRDKRDLAKNFIAEMVKKMYLEKFGKMRE